MFKHFFLILAIVLCCIMMIGYPIRMWPTFKKLGKEGWSKVGEIVQGIWMLALAELWYGLLVGVLFAWLIK